MTTGRINQISWDKSQTSLKCQLVITHNLRKGNNWKQQFRRPSRRSVMRSLFSFRTGSLDHVVPGINRRGSVQAVSFPGTTGLRRACLSQEQSLLVTQHHRSLFSFRTGSLDHVVPGINRRGSLQAVSFPSSTGLRRACLSQEQSLRVSIHRPSSQTFCLQLPPHS